jgi:hypothetical protein
MPPPFRWLPLAAALLASPAAAEPLHPRIDALVAARAAGKPASPPADDAEFLRRVWLDLAGRVPTADEARDFLADTDPKKREKLVDRLLAGPDYPVRMAGLFHVMLMERLGDNPEWTKYLTESFRANTPWDVMAREMLNPPAAPEARQAAGFFLAKRLENYGQNPVDYPALVRDVGRFFLGKDLRCAQCHDHLFVEEYKQQDFQGLYAFFQNVSLRAGKVPGVTEKPTVEKLRFSSVFKKVPRETAPKLPGRPELAMPALKKGEEYAVKPDPKTKTPGVPKFSTLAAVAEELPRADNSDFARNIVNRLWFVMLGRGLVHPLDLHHAANPPSHPELLDLLAKEFVAHKFDVKWLLRELALTQTYQRSSILPPAAAGPSPPPELFLTALEKRMSAEQLLASVETVSGQKPGALAAELPKFVKAYGNPAREPEDDLAPSLASALFVRNDPAVLKCFAPGTSKLVDRLAAMPDAARMTDELYLAVLTRLPTQEERADAAAYLAKNAGRRPLAVSHLAWALVASTEFCVNH